MAGLPGNTQYNTNESDINVGKIKLPTLNTNSFKANAANRTRQVSDAVNSRLQDQQSNKINLTPEALSSAESSTPSFDLSRITNLPSYNTPISTDVSGFNTATQPGLENLPSTQLVKNPYGNGYYYNDPTDPNKIIKDTRTDDYNLREQERAGLSPDFNQIDHIIPKWLGGADIEANKQRLDLISHQRKTTIDSVLRPLVENGVVNRQDAIKTMSNWNTLGTDGIVLDPSNANDITMTNEQARRYGYNPNLDANDPQNKQARLTFANDIYQQWQKNQPKEQKFDLGKFLRRDAGDLITQKIEEVGAPKQVADFTKGFTSGATLDWIKTQANKNADISDVASYMGGNITGSTVAFLGLKALAGVVGGLLTPVTGGIINPVDAIAAETALETALTGGKNVKKIAEFGKQIMGLVGKGANLMAGKTPIVAKDIGLGIDAAKTAEASKAFIQGKNDLDKMNTFKSLLNDGKAVLTPMGNVTNSKITNILGNSLLFATQGQLSRQEDDIPRLKRLMGDVANGAFFGTMDNMSKLAPAVLGTMAGSAGLSLLEGGDPKSAAENAVIGGALQLFTHGKGKDFTEVNKLINDEATAKSYEILKSYPGLENIDKITAENADDIFRTVDNFITRQNLQGLPDNIANENRVKATYAIKHLYKNNLAPDIKQMQDFQDVKSLRNAYTKFDYNAPVYTSSSKEVNDYINNYANHNNITFPKLADDASIPSEIRTTNQKINKILDGLEMSVREDSATVGKNIPMTGQGVENKNFVTQVNPYKENFEKAYNAQNNGNLSNTVIISNVDTLSPSLIKFNNEKDAAIQNILRGRQAAELTEEELGNIKALESEKYDLANMDKNLLLHALIWKTDDNGVRMWTTVNKKQINPETGKAELVNTPVPVIEAVPIGWIPREYRINTKNIEASKIPPSNPYLNKDSISQLMQDNNLKTLTADLNTLKFGNKGTLEPVLTFGINSDLLSNSKLANSQSRNAIQDALEWHQQNYDVRRIGGTDAIQKSVDNIGINDIKLKELSAFINKFKQIVNSNVDKAKKVEDLMNYTNIFPTREKALDFISNATNNKVINLTKTLINKYEYSAPTTRNLARTTDERDLRDARLLNEIHAIYSHPALEHPLDATKLKDDIQVFNSMHLLDNNTAEAINKSKMDSKLESSSLEDVVNYNDIKAGAKKVEDLYGKLYLKSDPLTSKINLNNTKQMYERYVDLDSKVSTKQLDAYDVANNPGLEDIELKIISHLEDLNPITRRVAQDALLLRQKQGVNLKQKLEILKEEQDKAVSKPKLRIKPDQNTAEEVNKVAAKIGVAGLDKSATKKKVPENTYFDAAGNKKEMTSRDMGQDEVNTLTDFQKKTYQNLLDNGYKPDVAIDVAKRLPELKPKTKTK